jgi:hypothetical protein
MDAPNRAFGRFRSAAATTDAGSACRRHLSAVIAGAAILALVAAAPAQLCIPQTFRAAPTDAVGGSDFGQATALSDDGNTAMIGAPFDDSRHGVAYVYVRAGSGWVQQAGRLLPTGEIGASQFGHAVALSADGNTAVIGAFHDNANVGAAYIFVRSGTAWAQQARLVGSGLVGAAVFGGSVSISNDGNTVMVAAYLDNSFAGALYVFTRSGTTWSQQGGKLTPTGATGAGQLGHSVCLSADGNTAVAGAWVDNTLIGAAYIFTRSGTTWSQQGPKLLPTGAAPGSELFGIAVSLSDNGNTALIGANADNTNLGAAYVFTRSGTTWTQYGNKLTPTGNMGSDLFGQSLAISGDASTILVGGYLDNNNIGASYVFTQVNGVWTQQNRLTPTGGVGQTQFGLGSALDATGRTALVGAPNDNTAVGAAYFFAVNPVSSITQQPVGSSVLSGSTAIFSVQAASAAPLSYQWRRNGVNIADGLAASGALMSGATTATLVMSQSPLSENGSAYDCVLGTPCDSVRSDPAGLGVTPRCPADFNHDGQINVADYLAFLAGYAAGC